MKRTNTAHRLTSVLGIPQILERYALSPSVEEVDEELRNSLNQ
jgi:hypothetical protein